MKATTEQREYLTNALTRQLLKLNLSLLAITSISDCWSLLCRDLNDISEDRPIGCGNAREWKLVGLYDSHIETAFRSILKQNGKAI